AVGSAARAHRGTRRSFDTRHDRSPWGARRTERHARGVALAGRVLQELDPPGDPRVAHLFVQMKDGRVLAIVLSAHVLDAEGDRLHDGLELERSRDAASPDSA